MNQLLQWVKKLAVFMILSSYMEHLLPESYRRYFHMCMGLILIVMMATPLLRVINNGYGIDFVCLLESLKTGSNVYQIEGEMAESFQDYYMQQYKEAVELQISQIVSGYGLEVSDMNFDIEEDRNKVEFGRLKMLSLTVKKEEDGNDSVHGLKNSLTTSLGLTASQIHIKVE